MSTGETSLSQNIHSTSKKRRRKAWIALPALLAILILSGFCYEWYASRLADQRFPMPGRLVEAGGFQLHIHAGGSGKPTVVLEAGSGENSWSWRTVPELLEPYATVVRYDRAGYAWSESSPSPRTGANIVRELHTALQEAGLSGPYILVGHSLGGMYMRLFAQTYPEDVTALVLVDARDEDQERLSLAALGNERLPEQPSPDVLAWLKRSGILRMFQDTLLTGMVDTADRGRFVDIAATSAYFHAKAEEAELAYHTEDAIRGHSLGALPVRIITRGLPVDGTAYGLSTQTSDKLEQIWQEGQKRLLLISTDAEQVIAKKSGHYIMNTEPELIVDVIRSLLPRE